MSGVQKCEYEPRRYAACSGDIGIKLAHDWFGVTTEQIEASAGRFKRGKFTGKLRGWIVWQTVRTGGWDFSARCVMRPGIIHARFCNTYEEMNGAMNGSRQEFMAGAVRVDSAYGHSTTRGPAAENDYDYSMEG